MSEFDPSLEPIQEPFTIRTHHLELFKAVIKGYGPQSLAHNLYSNSASLRGWEASIDNSYKVDVYGINQTDKNKVIGDDTEFLQSLTWLSDDYPVKLSAGKKDAICGSCIVGQHCTEYIPDEENRDLLYHKAFVATAKKLNLIDNIMITRENVTDGDLTPRDIPTIHTTAGTVRKVLTSKKFSRFIKNPPDANQGSALDYWYKLHPLRTVAGTIVSCAAVSGVFNAGEALQSAQSDEQINSATASAKISKEYTEDIDDMFKITGILVVAGIAYSILPRRRRH